MAHTPDLQQGARDLLCFHFWRFSSLKYVMLSFILMKGAICKIQRIGLAVGKTNYLS